MKSKNKCPAGCHGGLLDGSLLRCLNVAVQDVLMGPIEIEDVYSIRCVIGRSERVQIVLIGHPR